MLLDELISLSDHQSYDHTHSHTFFSKPEAPEEISRGEAMGIGAAIAGGLSVAAYAGWRRVSQWSLRDTGTQVPDFDPSTTPTGSKRGDSTTPLGNYSGIHGETGDPSEFLSPTPTGKVRKNNRARFF